MTVKLQENGSITIPARLRTLAGLSNGVQLEVKFLDGTILIRPKASQSSKAGGNETEYHKAIVRDLERARKTAKEPGMTHGPFTAREAADFLRKEIKARSKSAKQK